MSAFYPQVKPETLLLLQTIAKGMEKDPFYLDSDSCPYPEDMKSFLRTHLGLAANPVSLDLFPDDQALEEAVDAQIKRLINDLEGFSKQLGTADHSEKLQYFKTKSVLIDKLVNMQERIINLKEMSEFRAVVLQFMDEVCTKDQISDLMKRLDGIFGTTHDDL